MGSSCCESLVEKILEVLNEVRKKVLLYAQCSLTQSQFPAYRKLILDCFGKKGAEGDLERLFGEWNKRKGQGGNAQAICCEKGDRDEH
jgi:hypothetical protein